MPRNNQSENNILLEVEDLRTYFDTPQGVLPAVDGASFVVRKGESVGIVGESGCGKSVTALSIMRLVDAPGRICGGAIRFHGEDLLTVSEHEMEQVRGGQIGMIFQEPMTALNPVFTVGNQIEEAVVRHQRLSKDEARQRAIELLQVVGIPSPEERVRNYPHEMSGGMRQRAMIAMALSCSPALLIADEPTTALDVTIQAQILELLRELQADRELAILLITHDLGVVAEMVKRVIVMYVGRIVEEAPVNALFARPLHPYTQGLLASVPTLTMGKQRLHSIDGTVPNPCALPPGCTFAPRCPFVFDKCRVEEPPLIEMERGHTVRCWLYPQENVR